MSPSGEFPRLADALKMVPSLISIKWDTRGSDNHLKAVVTDVMRNVERGSTGSMHTQRAQVNHVLNLAPPALVLRPSPELAP